MSGPRRDRCCIGSHFRRARRYEGAIGRRVLVTARDLEVIGAVGKLRFATTSQLARLYFKGSRWAANKRLRKLLDAGLMRVWVRSLSDENVYTLRQRALTVLDAHDMVLPRQLDGNLPHTLMLNDVRIQFALGLEHIGARLHWWRSEWELRSHGRERVIPDALFAVERGGLVTVFALEVENQTRYPKGILKKLVTYRASPELYGEKGYQVLVVGRDARMLERYWRGAVTSGLGRRVWFASLADCADVSAPVWKSGWGPGERAFVELLADEE